MTENETNSNDEQSQDREREEQLLKRVQDAVYRQTRMNKTLLGICLIAAILVGVLGYALLTQDDRTSDEAKKVDVAADQMKSTSDALLQQSDEELRRLNALENIVAEKLDSSVDAMRSERDRVTAEVRSALDAHDRDMRERELKLLDEEARLEQKAEMTRQRLEEKTEMTRQQRIQVINEAVEQLSGMAGDMTVQDLEGVISEVGSSPAAEQVFSHDVETFAKPWTHKDFHNNPDHFQFAIVSDRTGGHRDGVFESAVDKLNLLRPEFVITVGDMIEGGSDDEAELREQWNEFNGFVNRLEMPFFYLPGNHDNDTPEMKKVYREIFGREHYAFIYKNVLFLCLDSQDLPDVALSDEQTQWAIDMLNAHADVRWTFVFMHQPLWVHEEGGLKSSRKEFGEGYPTGFGQLQELLAARPYTVLAGHFHQYIKFVREQRDYLILGSTGAGSPLRGPSFGEFDHAVWVTMTPEGPVIANLLLDGILDKEVHTETQLNFRHGIRSELLEFVDVNNPFVLSISIPNLFPHTMNVNLSFMEDALTMWKVSPMEESMRITEGETGTLKFDLAYSGDARYPQFPEPVATFAAGHYYASEISLGSAIFVDSLLSLLRPTTQVGFVQSPPVIDGVLDDAVWQRDPTASITMRHDMKKASVETLAWLAYDNDNFYVAMRCEEPELSSMKLAATNRDDDTWQDDSVEVFIGTNVEDETYTHYIVNAAGVLYDEFVFDKEGFNGDAVVKTARQEDAWTVEIAVPWTDLNIAAPDSGSRMNLQLTRLRTATGEIIQYPALNGGNHRPELHGFMEFAGEKEADD